VDQFQRNKQEAERKLSEARAKRQEADQKKREANTARDAVSVIKNLTIIRKFSTNLFYFHYRPEGNREKRSSMIEKQNKHLNMQKH